MNVEEEGGGKKGDEAPNFNDGIAPAGQLGIHVTFSFLVGLFAGVILPQDGRFVILGADR